MKRIFFNPLLLIFYCVTTIFNISCEKEGANIDPDKSIKKEEPKIDPDKSIKTIGDKVNVSVYHQFEDPLLIEFDNKLTDYLDLNNDSINDLKFNLNWGFYFGGQCYYYFTMVNAMNNTEIAADTSIKDVSIKIPNLEIQYEKRKIFSPMKFNFGDTIDNTLYWIKNEDLTINYQYDDCNEPGGGSYDKAVIKYNGWINEESYYMVFRICTQDTLIGWIKINNPTIYDLYVYEYVIY